ncbi:ankyrin repeat domain-containing protein [Streptomyces sp. NBC_00576]|uniref:ankyrin repeat domain-containing protein n=1 Tax=Streptomyces sp. NBC_00576 TaxID=2903665 RepID=UPI002E81D27F|nr:ankyrin repeat domain-containing protein [Streptomyces sp. NBC_00576]WUB71887.1 ankyrin repeat domain-containing protein [Streptomyces sp. NBC_00576]
MAETPDEWTDVRSAVEHEDLPRLRQLLTSGADVNEIYRGFPLLHHAIDTEADGALQSSEPLHVDTTAFLLARGADPKLKNKFGQDARGFADARGHWLAVELIDGFPFRSGG